MRRTILIVVALAVVTAACSGDNGTQVASLADAETLSTIASEGTDDTADVSEEEAILAFSACMRANGISDFEDPEFDANGGIVFGFRGRVGDGEVDQEAMRQAMDACREHLDGLAFGPGTGDRSEIEDTMYEFAACMRDNGYDMPDPEFGTPGEGDGQGGGPFADIDPEDPSYQAAFEICQDVFGGSIRLPGAGGPGGGPPPGDG
jgi:hypothetical protein